MKPSRITILAMASIAVLSLAAPGCALAALGDTADSVQSDQVKMKAAARVTRNAANYTVQEMQAANGTTVREYVSTSGKIFGVAWRGPTVPDLQQLLGQYFATLSDQTAIRRSSHTQLHVQKDDVVIHSSGHMRAFAGQAYLTSALPQGVSAADIQ